MAAVDLISDHILSQFTSSSTPLFVAVQGPQGSGKSFLTNLVKQKLCAAPHSLNVAVFSLDDIYLTHDALVELARSNPLNPLWKGRGQPGTHDVELGLRTLSALAGTEPVELPRFDKSLFNGEGDRLPFDGTGPIATPPLDVVILEGWFTGFYPISHEELESRWNGDWKEERVKLSMVDIAAVNDRLHQYIALWQSFTVFIQLTPDTAGDSTISRYSIVYKWRLQQEHDMKARNGGQGMSDDACQGTIFYSFVDRYIPGYVFWGDSIVSGLGGGGGSPPWLSRSLRIILGPERQVVGVEQF
ncbi:hypothetical protein DL96DRAFT_1602386 [Flagelloscypha sp. PMI_526]|nr:hypothetical protein DL96DRAFT_1602386 [Flagelloscypha sp. PMI_526]